jgi:MFS family permease
MPQDLSAAERGAADGVDAARSGPGAGYAWYALVVLVLVYLLNFIDRQLLTILAPDMKRDLGISDAQFGFLYGTAFGVFYSVFGIPLGKLADRWSRTRLLALGLATWSAMTALCGLSGNFAQLGAARVGVGVGEATAGPCGLSLLSDLFPPRRRATAIAIYTSGIYLGGGFALSLGTGMAHAWDHAWAGGARPLGLMGWQAAFLGLGLPGLAMAAWVSSLIEPRRGRFETTALPADPAPAQAFGAFGRDIMAILPPFTLIAAARRGTAGLIANLIAIALIVPVATGLTLLVGDPVQWIVLGTGVYAVASWAQAMRHEDPEGFARIWRNPPLLGVIVGYGLICAIAYSASAFGPSYAMLTYHAPAAQVALIVGGGGAAGGALGTVTGGWLGDRLSGGIYHSRRVLVTMAMLVLSLLPQGVIMLTHSLTVFYWGIFPMWFLISATLGSSAGTVVNVVPARLRGTASASYFLGASMLGLSLGPYAAGRISQATHSLWTGMVTINAVVPFSLLALAMAWQQLARKERHAGG